MNNLLILAEAKASAMDQLTGFLPIIGIFIVVYFFMIRPQQKKKKQMVKFRTDIKKGDKVVTIGGIHGKVNDIKEDDIILEISPNTTMRVDKNAIVSDTKDLAK